MGTPIHTLGRVNLTMPKKEGITEELFYPRRKDFEKSRGAGMQYSTLDLASASSQEGVVLIKGRKAKYKYEHRLMADGWVGWWENEEVLLLLNV